MVKYGLFRTIENDDAKNVITTLPEVSKEEAVLFAKNERNRVENGGKKVHVKYEGNSIIGSARRYVDSFMIVDDTAYKNMQGNEMTVGVFEFKKASDSKKSNG